MKFCATGQNSVNKLSERLRYLGAMALLGVFKLNRMIDQDLSTDLYVTASNQPATGALSNLVW